MDSETIAEEDLDAENDENLIEVIEDGFSKIAVIEASPRKNKGKQKKIRDFNFVDNFTSIISGRKRGYNEFDQFLEIVE